MIWKEKYPTLTRIFLVLAIVGLFLGLPVDAIVGPGIRPTQYLQIEVSTSKDLNLTQSYTQIQPNLEIAVLEAQIKSPQCSKQFSWLTHSLNQLEILQKEMKKNSRQAINNCISESSNETTKAELQKLVLNYDWAVQINRLTIAIPHSYANYERALVDNFLGQSVQISRISAKQWQTLLSQSSLPTSPKTIYADRYDIEQGPTEEIFFEKTGEYHLQFESLDGVEKIWLNNQLFFDNKEDTKQEIYPISLEAEKLKINFELSSDSPPPEFLLKPTVYKMNLFSINGAPFTLSGVGHTWMAFSRESDLGNEILFTLSSWPQSDVSREDSTTNQNPTNLATYNSIFINKLEDVQYTELYFNGPPYVDSTTFSSKELARIEMEAIIFYEGWFIPRNATPDDYEAYLINTIRFSDDFGEKLDSAFELWRVWTIDETLKAFWAVVKLVTNQQGAELAYDAVTSNCTDYSMNLWANHEGNPYHYKIAGLIPAPGKLYQSIASWTN